MKASFFCLSVVVISLALKPLLRDARAFPPKVVGAETPVSVQKHVPEAIRKALPQNAESRFFGISRMLPEGSLVAAHMYEILPHKSSVRYSLPQCRLDIFLAKEETPQAKWRRVNSATLAGIKRSAIDTISGDDFNSISMRWIWLKPKEQRIPVLMLDCSAPALYYWGNHIMMVFPNGLSKQACLQAFAYGADNSADGNGWKTSFDRVDERGFLMPDTGHGNKNGLNSPGAYTDSENYDINLRWNGREFVPVKLTR